MHCVFNGIDYTKNIDAKIAKNISAIYKNSNAFYQKILLHSTYQTCQLDAPNQTLQGG